MLHQRNGDPVSENTLRSWMERAGRTGGLPVTGHIHRLRHTFCWHLAMRGAPAKAIQELAGHAGSLDDDALHASVARVAQPGDPVARAAPPVGGNSGATKAEEKQDSAIPCSCGDLLETLRSPPAAADGPDATELPAAQASHVVGRATDLLGHQLER
jgi:integrase-like protein